MHIRSNEEESGIIFQNILEKLYKLGIEYKLQKNKITEFDFKIKNENDKFIPAIGKENELKDFYKQKTMEEKIILNIDKLELKIDQVEKEYEKSNDNIDFNNDNDKESKSFKAEKLLNMYMKVN